MHLIEALGIRTAGDLDPTRPLKVGSLQLGVEATAEAIRILSGEDFAREVAWSTRNLPGPLYWSIVHQSEGPAEVFGFPVGTVSGLPTAIEVAVVRALAAAPAANHSSILEGDAEITLGNPAAYAEFRKVIDVVRRPMAGESLMFEGCSQAILHSNISSLLGSVPLNCFENSFRTAPLKFRFLELYRMMEARFIADVKAKLLVNFDAEPAAALSDALDALKSEMNQIIGLAGTQQDAFEQCWTALHNMKNTNRFSAALFRRVEKKGANSGGKWKTGAALVYQIRCAVVHAGEKDIIFENFPDGEEVIEEVLPHVERAALLLVGIQLV